MSAVTAGVVVPVGGFKMLHKEAEAVAGAATVQEKLTWLVSGATLILNFCKKTIPRMGPTTVACKKCEVKSFPENWTVFMMKSQEEMDEPFAPLSRGPDGFQLAL